jgi:hypothetical protein
VKIKEIILCLYDKTYNFLTKNKNMKIHLSAVGTSLLRNAEDKDPKIKDKHLYLTHIMQLLAYCMIKIK